MYTYPAPAPTLAGDVETISRFLNSPTVIARRLRTLVEQRYIADSLLSGRYQVQGGAVLYETGESIFTADSPRAVAPGSQYPLTTAPTGAASMAKTVKWGQDTYITDEAISRQNFQPVDKAMVKLINQNVRYVDGIALSAIATAITSSQPAATTWATSTAQQKLTDVATAKAQILALNQGYTPDTVVVDDLTWAYAYASFTGGGFLPREQTENATVSGNFAVIDGMRWLSTPNLPTTGTVLVVDSTTLGGMADEDLGGPGYTPAGGVGVQAKTIRDDEADRWRMRMRRVTVPIVVEPASGRKIVGV